MSEEKKQAVKPRYRWHKSEHGDFRVEKTRMGLYKSVDRQGNDLCFSLTEEAIIQITPSHLYWNSDKYNGEDDISNYSGTVDGKL
tara:strand:- start:26972 stop:27226 length:255 start_codon:yes stop_codon:yes gene_type:complete